MEHYSLLRQFADSWFLLLMFAFFAGIIIWVIFGRSKSYRDSANMIFRHEDKPEDETRSVAPSQTDDSEKDEAR